MWIERVLYAPLFLLLFSCTDRIAEAPETEIEDSETPGTSVFFQTGETKDVSLLIFRREGDRFSYQSTIDKGWSTDGKITISMDYGDYQFLFLRSDGTGIELTPHPLQPDTELEEIRFNARTNSARSGEMLPVNELFLPEPEEATRIYAIQGEETVSCTLKRAVSRLLLVLKRGHAENGTYVPEPYEDGKNILDDIREAHITIAGVGTSANIYGTQGAGILSTTFSEADKDSLTGEGFAAFTGPFFLPPADNEIVEVSAVLFPKNGAAEETIQKTVKGTVKKNEQLQVVLWIKTDSEPEGDRLIGITVDTKPISDETEGDKGIWE